LRARKGAGLTGPQSRALRLLGACSGRHVPLVLLLVLLVVLVQQLPLDVRLALLLLGLRMQAWYPWLSDLRLRLWLWLRLWLRLWLWLWLWLWLLTLSLPRLRLLLLPLLLLHHPLPLPLLRSGDSHALCQVAHEVLRHLLQRTLGRHANAPGAEGGRKLLEHRRDAFQAILGPRWRAGGQVKARAQWQHPHHDIAVLLHHRGSHASRGRLKVG